MKQLFTVILTAAMLYHSYTAVAQTPKKPASLSLYRTVMEQDKQVFDAYNKCDLDKFEDYFDRDVEFFHDLTGYTESRHDLMKTMKALCASGGMQRQLVSAKVYPLDFYGAVEIGMHRFYKTVKGKKQLANTARFINIWKQKDDKWRIVRVISYDHKGD